MIKATGLTIWLEPPEEIKKRLSGLIKDLAFMFGTPEFDPHITLIGAINQPKQEVLDKTARLANLLEPYIIDLTGKVVCEVGDWTRTMIILARQTKPLMDAYEQAIKIFGMNPGKYTPHLSLMYAETILLEERLKAAQELDPNLLKATFEIKHLSLIETNGEPKNWKKFKDFKLQSSRHQP